jgi:hypothetical protein
MNIINNYVNFYYNKLQFIIGTMTQFAEFGITTPGTISIVTVSAVVINFDEAAPLSEQWYSAVSCTTECNMVQCLTAGSLYITLIKLLPVRNI